MEHTFLTADQLKAIFSGQKKHKAYKVCIEIAKKLSRHADSEGYGDLIEKRRPSESAEIKKYREEIMVAITEGTFSKILTCLSKIRKSRDWSIKYDSTAVPASVATGEHPEDYLEKSFTEFNSITNWMFQLCMKQYLVDPNALCCIMPSVLGNATDYLKPVPVIFNSEQVWMYREGEYAVLASTDKATYTDGSGQKKHEGRVFYFINTQVIYRYEQSSDDVNDLRLVAEYKHDLDELPLFKLKGVAGKTMDKTVIFKSRLHPIVPFLDEAVREYSDLQAEVVQHIHSTFWYIAGQDCTECRGSGFLPSLDKGPVKCDKCGGSGKPPLNPYQSIQVKAPGPGETQPHMPPAGYVQKDIGIVKIQDERVDKHMYKALSAINLEFLAQVPLTISGEGKKVDRDELTTFVNTIAEDIVAIMDNVAHFVIAQRYSFVVNGDKEVLKAMAPKINVPDQFDIFTSDYLLAELTSARTAGVNAFTITSMEIEYTGKKFTTDPGIRDFAQAVLQLDPMPNIKSEDKLMMLQNKGISMTDYVLSCNIYVFLRQAVEGDAGFFGKPFEEKRKALITLTKKVISENSAKDGILSEVENHPNPVPTPILEYVDRVAEGKIPVETGIALSMLAMPEADPTMIENVFKPFKTGE